MKGLLIKDFYLLTKYCRMVLAMILLFTAVSIFVTDSAFFVFYPIVVTGMIPVTLISYDEREKWNSYSAALPYTRGQLVSAKYLICLALVLAVTVVCGILQALFPGRGAAPSPGGAFSLVSVFLFLGLAGPSILLPFIFKLGAEKGRIAYYIVLGALCVAIVFLSKDGQGLAAKLNVSGTPAVLIAAGAVIYAASWLLSTAIYKKREL